MRNGNYFDIETTDFLDGDNILPMRNGNKPQV